MVVSSTGGGVRTGLWVAHLATNPVQTIASLVVGAVLVVLTLASDASQQGIALVAGLAHAIGAMVLGETLGTLAAVNRAVTARIQTLFVVARLVVGTVGIALAFGCEKGKVRIRHWITVFKGLKYLRRKHWFCGSPPHPCGQ